MCNGTRVGLGRFTPPVGLQPGTANSEVQLLIYSATEAPASLQKTVKRADERALFSRACFSGVTDPGYKTRHIIYVYVVLIGLYTFTFLPVRSGPEVIKLFFMLNSVEHKILNAHKYKNIKKSNSF